MVKLVDLKNKKIKWAGNQEKETLSNNYLTLIN